MTIGSDVNDLPAGCLRMHVIECTCTRCHHSWTHSEMWGRRHHSTSYFHYVDKSDLLEAEYTHIEPMAIFRKIDGCFKCIPLAIKLEPKKVTAGRGKPPPLPAPSASSSPRTAPIKKQLTLEDL